MMIFNKLQGFTLVSLLFLFNVRPYDFAEDVAELVENAEEISGEMAEMFETAVEEGKVAAEHVQEIGDSITEALGESFSADFGQSLSEVVGESLAEAVDESITEAIEESITGAIREVVNGVGLPATDAQDIQNQITAEFAKEAKTQQITKITQDKIKGLPKLKKLLKPKILGVVVAIIIVVAVMVKFYLGRRPADWPKYMEEQVEKLMSKEVSKKLTAEEQTKVKSKKAAIKTRISELIKLGNVTPILEQANQMAVLMKKAQGKLGIKMPEIFSLFKKMSNYEELKEFKKDMDYAQALREKMNKTPLVPEEGTAALILYDKEWSNISSKYITAQSSETEAEKWLKLMKRSDSEILKVDMMKTVDENLSNDK